MKKIFLQTSLALTFLFITACSTQIIFKADPLDEKEVYNRREIVTKETDEAVVSVEFDGQSENDFVFYVEIENRSDELLTINPVNIFAEAVKKDLSSIDKDFGPMWAADPKSEIARINKEKEGRKTMHSVTTGLNAAFTLLSIIGTLSDKDTGHDGHKVVHDVVVWADNQVREEIDYRESMKHLESQRKFWKNEVLNYTELKKNERVGGLVFIPFNPKIKYMRLIIPVNNTDFEFYYKQVRVD
jgi:hypothetical protein